MAVSDTTRAVKLWEVALRQLEKLPTGSSRAGSCQQQHAAGAPLKAMDDVLPTVDKFLELPKLHAAVYTKLVADLKIPLQLGKAASSTSDPVAPKATAAVSGIGALIHRAMSEGHLQIGVPNALSRQFGQQLKQSGYLAALPKLLAAAAVALADTWQDPQVLAVTPHNLNIIRNSTTAEHSAAARHVLRMQELASWLLLAVSSCVYFWPQQFDRVAVAAPALRLCVITMQHCSRCADLIPTGSAATAVAPTALEQLMATAYTSGQAVFAAWDPERLAGGDFDTAVLECPDAMRAVCCLAMVPIICPKQYFAETPQLVTSIEARTNNVVKIRNNTPASNSNSLAAWQYACAHASEVTDIQQQTLQALGCSSRLFMYMAGNALKGVLNSNSILGGANVYVMLARHSVPLADLNRPGEMRKLAANLQQLQKGATPPGTSPLLPCASLLWLMPAVLLQWASKQPARGPHFALQHYTFSTLFWPSVEQVLEQHDCWVQAESKFFDAAGGNTAREEQQQAMVDAVRAMFLGGALMAPIVPASQQNLTPEQARKANMEKEMYESASAAAFDLSKAWTPPAVCLAQLLQQAGGAAVRMLACMQAEADADPAGSSSASTSSSPGSTKPSSSGSKARSSRKSRSKYGDIAPVSSGSDAYMLSRALLRLSQGTVALLNLSTRVLWNFVNKARIAARFDPMIGMERYGMFSADRVGVDPDQLDEEEQGNLAALCTALQEAVPQLASLVDATMRTSVEEESRYTVLAVSANFLRMLLVPGVFVAAGLRPGTPALKPLASLATTVLKVVSAVQDSVAMQDPKVAVIAAGALRKLLSFNCILLEVACNGSGSSRSGSSSGSSGTNSQSADVIAVLTSSKAVSDKDSNMWSAAGLVKINNTCKPASSSSAGVSGSGSGSSGTGDGSGSMDAVAMVPWLVGLGRCCLGYVGTMRVMAGAGAATAGGDNLQAMMYELDGMGTVLQCVSAALPSWLRNPSVSAQLASAGYVKDSLPELLQSVSKAQKIAAQAGPNVLAQSAQGLGLALSSMPFGSACNNPLCRELVQLSEQQLVMGSARKCSGCRVARYCSKTCQKVHWKQHKAACKAIAAATAHADTTSP